MISKQHFKVAVHFFKKAMQSRDEDTTLKGRFKAMTNLVIIYLQELGRVTEAVAILDEMLSRKGELAQDMEIEALVFKGVALRKLGRNAEAKQILSASWQRAQNSSHKTMFSMWGGSYSRAATCPYVEMDLDNKGRLQARIQRLRRVLNDPIREVPRSFILPRQHAAFVAAAAASPSVLWLLKPHAMSYGMGMRVLKGPAELPERQEGWHVQEYLVKPLTVFGHKVDLRVYILIASMWPLTMHVYEEGLVRMAIRPYSVAPEDLDDRSIHLTALYPKPKKASKIRSVSNLFKHLNKAEGKDTTGLWEKITAAVVKVVKLVVSDMDPRHRQYVECFKIFGVDVLVTDELEPYILEVNRSPDMSVEGETSLPEDVQAKAKLIHDMAEIASTGGEGISPTNGFHKV